ncbi:MAG TPA: hypothetical protein VN256_02305 [Pyrinomonadaceae bacterium]|nr:hypothetical protein [Pyrinomonadaceae bacterium]
MRAKHSPLLILTLLASGVAAPAQGIRSVYTTLRVGECKTLQERDGFLLMECPGVGGYKLQVEAHDINEMLIVVKPDGSKHTLSVGRIGRGGYPAIGFKAEWRVRGEKGKVVPVALIVRVTISEYAPADPGRREVAYLAVSKITPQEVCLTEAILAGRNSNAKARRLADDAAGKPCHEESGAAGP